MGSLTADLSVLAGLVGLLAFLLLSTVRINRNRKDRMRKRRLTDRLLHWK
jgi:hypothetical protein